VLKSDSQHYRSEQSADAIAIVLMCRSHAKLKSFIEKSKKLQKSLSVTQNSVQFSLKVVR